MAAPTAVAEEYLNCVNSVLTLGTTPDTWVGKVIEGGVTFTYDVDEMTNTGSLGGYEDVKTTYKYEGDLTIAFSAAEPPPYVAGDVFGTVIKGPVGGVTLTGNFRFNAINDPLLTVKGGYKQKCKITSQGAIVRSVSA